MTVTFTNSTYQTDTPRWLWDPWTNGPGADPDRYAERIQALIALDALLACPDRLDPEERSMALSLTEQLGYRDDLDIRSRVEEHISGDEPWVRASEPAFLGVGSNGDPSAEDSPDV